MGLGSTDSSGTADDLPQNHLKRCEREARITGNAKDAVKGSRKYSKKPNGMEIKIHQLEQEAYSSILRAFKAQSDGLSWEKESLITDLRKELRVSDEEHREILAAVDADDMIRRIRVWRQTDGVQSGLLDNVQPVLDGVSSPISTSRKKQKTSHQVTSLSLGVPSPGPSSQKVVAAAQPSSSPAKGGASSGIRGKKTANSQSLPHKHTKKPAQFSSDDPVERGKMVNQDPPNTPTVVETATALVGRKIQTRWPEDNTFYEAVITSYNPAEDRHALVYDMDKENETWEWVNLGQFSPNDIRWDSEDPCTLHHSSHGSDNGRNKSLHLGGNVSAASGRKGSMNNQPKDNFPSLQNGDLRHASDDIEIFSTDILLKKVRRIFGASHPDPVEVETAKKLLKVQERSLINALERIADASDGISGGMDQKNGHAQSNDLQRGWKRHQHPGRHRAGNQS